MQKLFKFLLIFSIVLGCDSNKSRPNVIFILVDDLGWNDLGYSGNTFYEPLILIIYLKKAFNLLMHMLQVQFVLQQGLQL